MTGATSPDDDRAVSPAPRGQAGTDDEGGRPELVTGFSRGLAVIRSFATSPTPMTIADIAKAVGLNRSTARRFVRTLEVEGYVAADDGRYSLQPKVLDLGFAYLASVPVDEAVQRCLFRAAETVRESCLAAVLDGHDAVVIARAQTSYPRVMTLALTAGSRMPAHLTAVGRVLLAALPEDDLARYLDTADLQHHATATVMTTEDLRRELDTVREQGYSIVDQEIELGVRACAILVPRRNHAPIAASISSHATRGTVDTILREHVPVLQSLRDDLVALLDTGD